MTRRALTLVPWLLFAFVLSLSAQHLAPPADAPQASDSAQQSAKRDEQQDKPPNKQQKTEGSKDAAAATTDEGAAFDERAATEVLNVIRNGLAAHSQRLLLSAFDPKQMDGFLTFEDQIEAYYTRYEAFRVNIRLVQTSEENNRGAILAEFQLESEPRGGGQISRREGPLRFELVHGPKGWKIVDFTPRGFFS